MGHAEMLLAVAGLNQLQVDHRVRTLASGDWSTFAPHERVILHFARKVSKQPQSVSRQDINTLVQHLGQDRTIDWLFHLSWCNFMTRVADAFQIPLEPVNVFMEIEKKRPKPMSPVNDKAK